MEIKKQSMPEYWRNIKLKFAKELANSTPEQKESVIVNFSIQTGMTIGKLRMLASDLENSGALEQFKEYEIKECPSCHAKYSEKLLSCPNCEAEGVLAARSKIEIAEAMAQAEAERIKREGEIIEFVSTMNRIIAGKREEGLSNKEIVELLLKMGAQYTGFDKEIADKIAELEA
jgi:hypothetical protein